MSQYPRMPSPPPELWMLWNGRGWVASVDDAPGGPTYLVAFGEAEAKAAAEHQARVYDVDCVPIRIHASVADAVLLAACQAVVYRWNECIMPEDLYDQVAAAINHAEGGAS